MELIVKLERIGTTGSYVRGPLTGNVGQTVYYKMVVTNTGNVSSTVALFDPHGDSGPQLQSPPCAFGLSAFSNVPGLLGTDVSHGCIRVSNVVNTGPSQVLPRGKPVEIVG